MTEVAESGIAAYITKFGRYQVYAFALTFIPFVVAGTQALSFSFTTAVPPLRSVSQIYSVRTQGLRKLRCCVPKLEVCNGSSPAFNSSEFASERSKYWHSANDRDDFCFYCPDGVRGNASCGMGNVSVRPCDAGIVFDRSVYQSSLSMELGLVCGRAYQHELISTTYMGGVLLAGLIAGFVSDGVGRRPTLLIGVGGCLVTFSLTPLSRSLATFLLASLANGFFNNIVYLTAFIVRSCLASGCSLLSHTFVDG